MSKRILFVDDEQNILNGLKRSLRSQKNDWDMFFALGGQEALELSKKNSFDAVVTDLRMPAVDGLQVVEALMKHQPEIIRVILSGHSDEKLVMNSTGLVHQFLAKPCDCHILITTLNRTFALKELLENIHLQSLVGGIKSLPSIPAVYQEIMSALESPVCSLQDIGKIVQTDPAMTVKILQLVNTAFFGVGSRISDPVEAVTRLGLDITKALVLSVGIFSQFDEKKVKDKEFSLDKLWQHCLRVADLAKRIASTEKASKSIINDAFLAGLVHEIGILILEDSYSEEYARVRELSVSGDIPLYQAEQEIFETTHAALGAYLLGLWSLNDDVVEAVAFHHQPELSGCTEFNPLIAVHVADQLSQDEFSDGCTISNQTGELAILERIGLAERIEIWKSLRAEESEA